MNKLILLFLIYAMPVFALNTVKATVVCNDEGWKPILCQNPMSPHSYIFKLMTDNLADTINMGFDYQNVVDIKKNTIYHLALSNDYFTPTKPYIIPNSYFSSSYDFQCSSRVHIESYTQGTEHPRMFMSIECAP